MSLIKCDECSKEVSDSAKKCPHCGAPIKKARYCVECGEKLKPSDKFCPKCGKKVKKKSKAPIIIGAVVLLFILIVSCSSGSGNKLVCKVDITNDVGIIRNELIYTFASDGSIATLEGHQYAKPSDATVAEYLWTVTNKNQDQYNHYDGLTYKATYSEDKEIKLNYTIDAKKAPTMFEAVASLSGISGKIKKDFTKEEIRKVYESEKYTCN